MAFRSSFSAAETVRLSTLENSWISSKQLPYQPKRHQQMSKDIKKFVFNSMEREKIQAERMAELRARKTEGADTFGKISSTFNFTHHEGTEAKTEMKVVKIILVREGQISTLGHLSQKSKTTENVSYFCSAILEVLAEIRESTLNYLEALCLWRNSIPDGHTMSPRAFFWEEKNYTLKIVSDLNFLADNALIIRALNIPAEQFRSNPLMLTNNLFDPNTWMNPVDRAGQDVGGIMQGPAFESRLRLRYAERILLQEIELFSSLPAEEAGSTFLTESQQSQTQIFSQHAARYQPGQGLPAMSMATSSIHNGRAVSPGGPSATNAEGSRNPYPYLTPPVGIDPAYLQEKFPELAPTTFARPESRTAASAGNTAGALARRQRSGAQSAGGILPDVDSSSRARGSVSAGEMFPPMEEEFPPAPGQSAEPMIPTSAWAERRPKAVSRSSLTKQGIEVTPYYTEVATNIYKYPLLIALLTSTRRAQSPTPQNRLMTSSLASRSRDPDDYSDGFDLEQPSVYGSRSETKLNFDRLVVKVYDVMGCAEYLINANISEYVAFRAELDAKYDNNAFRHFHPEDRDWWSANIRHLIRVQLKRNGTLHMTISKTSIDEVVLAAIHKAEEEKMGRRVTRKTQRIIKRHSVSRIASSDNDLTNRKSRPSKIVLEPHLVRNTYDSMKTHIAPTSLDDDYDYDFDA